MYHLKLIKGMSYTNGIISATQKEPDVYTEDKAIVDIAVKSGYFVLLNTKNNNESLEGENNKETTHLDKAQLEKMTISDLKKLAVDMGIDITGFRYKVDYVTAIAAQEIVFNEENNDEAPEGEIDYGEE